MPFKTQNQLTNLCSLGLFHITQPRITSSVFTIYC